MKNSVNVQFSDEISTFLPEVHFLSVLCKNTTTTRFLSLRRANHRKLLLTHSHMPPGAAPLTIGRPMCWRVKSFWPKQLVPWRSPRCQSQISLFGLFLIIWQFLSAFPVSFQIFPATVVFSSSLSGPLLHIDTRWAIRAVFTIFRLFSGDFLANLYQPITFQSLSFS